jgi:hypothetical protein
MISLQKWMTSLEVCVLAGQSGLGGKAEDLYFLSPQTEWITEAKPSEFANKIVLIPARVVPGYSSTFDILVRILKGAGAVAAVYLGGKRTDFAKGTLLLCDHLGLPLLWIQDDVNYAALIRSFYRRLIEQEQGLQAELEWVRQRIDAQADDLFSLAAWLHVLERELQVEAALAIGDGASRSGHWASQDGRRCLVIPLRIGANYLSLRLFPRTDCRFYEADGEEAWVSTLASVLKARTENFLLEEIPGIDTQMHWTMLLEAALFGLLSLLPAMDFRQPVDPVDYTAVDGLPKVVGGLSLRRRIPMLDLERVRTISVLWITLADSEDGVALQGESFSLLHTPYPYRVFQTPTLVVRDRVLSLLHHPRYQTDVRAEHLCCLPWRDWERREGVVVVWCSESDSGQPSTAMVRELVDQWEARLRKSLRGTFHQLGMTTGQTVEEVLREILSHLDKTYYQFLSLPDGIRGVQFVQHPGDAASLLMFGVERAASLEQALQLLQPILADKYAEVLLESLEAYLESGARIQAAADRMFLHRNTLRYRLNRVQELLGVDLGDPQVRLTYQLALRAWRLRQPRSKGAFS